MALDKYGVPLFSSSEVPSRVPMWRDSLQAGTNSLRVWSPLSVFIPATFKDFPQFSDKSKMRGSDRLVWSDPFQDVVAGRVLVQTVIRLMSAEYLARTLSGIRRYGNM